MPPNFSVTMVFIATIMETRVPLNKAGNIISIREIFFVNFEIKTQTIFRPFCFFILIIHSKQI